mgnify:CR=1 FL=1
MSLRPHKRARTEATSKQHAQSYRGLVALLRKGLCERTPSFSGDVDSHKTVPPTPSPCGTRAFLHSAANESRQLTLTPGGHEEDVTITYPAASVCRHEHETKSAKSTTKGRWTTAGQPEPHEVRFVCARSRHARETSDMVLSSTNTVPKGWVMSDIVTDSSFLSDQDCNLSGTPRMTTCSAGMRKGLRLRDTRGDKTQYRARGCVCTMNASRVPQLLLTYVRVVSVDDGAHPSIQHEPRAYQQGTGQWVRCLVPLNHIGRLVLQLLERGGHRGTNRVEGSHICKYGVRRQKRRIRSHLLRGDQQHSRERSLLNRSLRIGFISEWASWIMLRASCGMKVGATINMLVLNSSQSST